MNFDPTGLYNYIFAGIQESEIDISLRKNLYFYHENHQNKFDATHSIIHTGDNYLFISSQWTMFILRISAIDTIARTATFSVYH